MLLIDKDLVTIRNAYFQAALSYDGNQRTLLTSGISPLFLLNIPVGNPPAIQVALDLKLFNDIERLSDGVVPLEVWLRNAVSFYGVTPGGVILKSYLSTVQRAANGAPVVKAPTATLPRIKEAIIDRDETLPIGFLAGGARVAGAVVKLLVPQYRNAVAAEGSDGPIRYLGTGWLIGGDLIMTNHHVINARKDGEADASADDRNAQVLHTTALFDYDADGSQPVTATTARLEAWDIDLDYALLRMVGVPADRSKLPLRSAAIYVQNLKDFFPVNIIQHPRGNMKRVALRSNLVYDSIYPRIRYFTDTEQGSSGSPVFDDAWRVVALHSAATDVDGVEFQGRSTGWVNEGTQIGAILEHIGQHNPGLLAEINA